MPWILWNFPISNVKKINGKTKILLTSDNFHLYELNSITANACDLVLCCDPFATLQFKERGYEAFPFFLTHHVNSSSKNINKNNNEKKEIDVLFFGSLTSNRNDILDYIVKEGISLKNVGYEGNV